MVEVEKNLNIEKIGLKKKRLKQSSILMKKKEISRLAKSVLLFASLQLSAFEDPSINTSALADFWMNQGSSWGAGVHRVDSADACKPENYISQYNSLEINGVFFPGVRPWLPRWEVLSKSGMLKGRRILDLGANIGLASVFAKKYGGASHVTAVEGDYHTYKQIDVLSKIFGADVESLCVDLNEQGFERKISTDYDIVFCFSVYKWIKNKDEFLSFLSRYASVLFEGHDKNKETIRMMKKIGFPHHKILGVGNNKRSFILFSRRS